MNDSANVISLLSSNDSIYLVAKVIIMEQELRHKSMSVSINKHQCYWVVLGCAQWKSPALVILVRNNAKIENSPSQKIQSQAHK